MDLNRGLFLQSQDCMLLFISLDELKENPSFILSALRSILFPYLSAERSVHSSAKRTYSKIECDLMRSALRPHRIFRPAEAARELELHTTTVIKTAACWWIKGNFTPWQEEYLSELFIMSI